MKSWEMRPVPIEVSGSPGQERGSGERPLQPTRTPTEDDRTSSAQLIF